MTRLFSFVALALLLGCTEPVSRDDNSRILVLGDSLMAIYGMQGKSVAHAMEERLAQPVTDRSVMGARYLYRLPISGSMGFNITKQYRSGDWDWVVLNGGGNDLWFGCGCGACTRKMDKLISPDGRRGAIPGFVGRLRGEGAQVIYVGYLRTPGVTSPIEGCADEGNELDRRVARLAALDAGVHFLSLADLVPPGDRSYHALDLIHPSAKASAEIGRRIAEIIGK